MITQMEAAKKGTLTPAMQAVAASERMSPESLRENVAAGRIVIPGNPNHRALLPAGIGEGLRTKINVNIGVSRDCCDTALELEKARIAVALKADAVMDLSCHGKTREFRRRLLEESPLMVGTVPVYDAVGLLGKELKDIGVDEFFHVVETHAEDGVDFMTVHCGMSRATVEKMKRNPRLTRIVSRGGSLLFSWMEMNRKENPFYEHYDRLLEICAAHDITLSLGDACRPGSIHDSTDAAQVEELIVLGELTRRAWSRNVQVMIEGPGHMAINEIAANMLMEKRLCHGAPFYVLGPLVTDVAPGHDHITSAIGGAIAAANGADFLCFVTPAEHLRLPSLEDTREGIIAARIAAHAADIAKGVPQAREWDDAMSRARADVDFSKMIELAVDPEKARNYRKESTPAEEGTCTMCGDTCPMRSMKTILR
ncbi:MAG: phosphomethylpyrimidine synthase ThiC [Desulfobacterales bacterium]|nr:phosphomethylpyrimidine synthase ThiC [Desulfobacterales bacterium]